jgi:allantoin racemase
LQQILLINPNSSGDTTAMMVAIAQACCSNSVAIIGATATRSPPMIITADALAAAADEVVEIGMREAPRVSGIIVSAFGDPGLETLRRKVSIPVVGICEASMIEAAAGHRRFGVATVTPDLAALIEGRARELNLLSLYAGIRLTTGDPIALAGDAARLQVCLARAVAECFEFDHAEAVIIGGGPLGQAATDLAGSFRRPVIAPIPAAMQRLLRMISKCYSATCDPL